MSIKKFVFGGTTERNYYYKLKRIWGDKYAIYHNLPFLNIFSTDNLSDYSDWRSIKPIALTDIELSRLKKESVDYTLCDEKDSPILCIEFDGLQQGYNIGTTYHPLEPGPTLWRREFMELKLKVALGSRFPYFVVGSEQFNDIHPDAKLSIVDAIIGDVLSTQAASKKIYKGFNPTEVGMTDEEFGNLLPEEQHEVIQDWVLSVETDSEFEHNPIIREGARLHSELRIGGWTQEYLTYPSLDTAKTVQERTTLLENAIRYGAKVTLHTSDLGDVHSTVWLPNFKAAWHSGMTLSTEIALLLVLERLRRMRANKNKH